MKHIFVAILIAAACMSPVTGQQQLQVDLSLQDAIQLAQKHGSAIAQAHLQQMVSAGAIVSANGDFDPVVFSNINYNYNESPASGFFSSFGDIVTTSYSASQGLRSNLRTGGNLEFKLNEGYDDFNYLGDTQSNTSMSLSFAQPLLRGAFSVAATANEHKAKITNSADALLVTQSKVDAVQAVVDAYWNLSFALSDLEVKNQSLILAENLRGITIAKFKVGAVAEVEVTQTRADIASRQDGVLVAQNAVDTNHDVLRRLISAFDTQNDWQVDFNLVSNLPIVAAVNTDWQVLWNTALSSRGDIKKLQLDIEAAQLDLDVAANGSLPQLDFMASGTYSAQDRQVSSSLDRLFERDFPGYTVGFTFEMPLSNNQSKGAIQQAKNRLLLAKRVLRDRSSELALEVRRALHDVNYFTERVAVTTHAANMAQLKLESEQLRLNEGASTNYQVLQIQSDLAVAQSQQLQAQTEYAKAVVKLDTVQGQSPKFL